MFKIALRVGLYAKPAPLSVGLQGYRRDIDGLRAIAVIAVLMYHSGVSVFGGGYVGVDIFFVISGYLITGHLALEISQKRLSISRFYANRIRRIAPAFFVMLMATWGIGVFVFLPADLIRTSSALIAAAGSVSNLYFLKYTSYFAPASIFQPLLHTWSLSIEEQFYIFVPVTMLFASKFIRGHWLYLFGPLCVVSFVLSLYLTDLAPVTNFYFMPARAWELGIGAIIATTPLPRIKTGWVAQLIGLAGLLLVAIPIILFDELTVFPGVNALYPCLGTAILIYIGKESASHATTLIGSDPLVWLGKISYSIYLVHWPIIAFTRYITLSRLTSYQVLMVIGSSVAFGYLSWRFVEQPFRRPSSLFTQRHLLIGGAGSIVFAVLIGLIGLEAKGFPARFPNYVEHIPSAEEWKPGRCFLIDKLDYRNWSTQECTRISTGPHKVLLWGDSFAAQYIPGILTYADDLKMTLLQYTAAACLPILAAQSFPHLNCANFNAHAVDIIRDQHIDTVILAGRWTTLERSGLDAIESTLNTLKVMGIHTIIIGQSPEFAEDPHMIAYLTANRSSSTVKRWNIVFDPSLNNKLHRIIGLNQFVNPMPTLCENSSCIYQDNGVFLFDDYGHYSEDGSRRVVFDLFVKNNLIPF